MEDGQPGAEIAAAVLNVACLALLLVVFWCEWARWNDQPALRALRRPLPLAFGLMMVCAALWPDNAQKWCDLADTARSGTGDPAWYGDKNPLGYSRELIAWARALPARHRIASNPVDCAMLTVYSPQYLCVQPVGSVIADAPERERAEKGKHPFYRPIATSSNSWSVDHAEAHAWLRERRADYVLINRHDYDSPALEYFQAHPECYELVFENSVAREAVFRTR